VQKYGFFQGCAFFLFGRLDPSSAPASRAFAGAGELRSSRGAATAAPGRQIVRGRGLPRLQAAILQPGFNNGTFARNLKL